MRTEPTPVLAFVAFSGTGKTTLIEQLIPLLRARGIRLGLIKHSHHHFDIDHPGKDSFRFRKAGAAQVMVASRKRWALITEHEDDRPEPSLEELLGQFDHTHLDLILVEGFKHEALSKIELHRPSLGKPLMFPEDASIIAIACDAPLPMATELPQLELNDPEAIADFVITQFLHRPGTGSS